MGAGLSTIQTSLRERFQQQDKDQKGYLRVSEIVGMQPQFGVSPCHIAVLFLLDRNLDGRFSLEEVLEFAAFSHNYARVHRAQEAGFMITGYASLKLWSFLHSGGSAHTQFVDWAVRMFTDGCVGGASLPGTGEPLASKRALKTLHAVFEMERNHSVPYDALQAMVQQAAEEEQLVPRTAGSNKERWVPLAVLSVFVAAVAEGVVHFMASFTADAGEGELLEVLRRTEAAVADLSSAGRSGRGSSGGGSGGGGGMLTPLNLRRQAAPFLLR